MTLRGVACWMLVFTSSCIARDDVELPALAPGDVALLIAWGGPGTEVEHVEVDDGTTPLRWAMDDGRELHAVHYPSNVLTGITPGTPLDLTNPQLELPSIFTQYVELDLDDSGGYAWVEQDALGALGEIKILPAFDPRACYASGGCAGPRANTCSFFCPDAVVAPPIPPRLCGSGPDAWPRDDQLSIQGIEICGPPPFVHLSCDDGRVHFPYTEGCVEVGAECPTGPWFEGQLEGSVFYVDPSFAGVGTGTIDAPFTRLIDALDVATSSSTILLSKGDHNVALGQFQSISDVRIVGACARDTRIHPSLRFWMDTASELHNVTVTSTAALTLYVTGVAKLQGVVVDGSGQASIWITAEGDLTASEMWVRGSTVGIAMDGGTANITRAVISDARTSGFAIYRSSKVELKNVLIEEISSPNEIGYAIVSNPQCEIEATQIAVMGASAASLVSMYAHFSDSYFSGTSASGSTLKGAGIAITSGATLALERVVLENHAYHGLSADTNARIVAEDIIINTTASLNPVSCQNIIIQSSSLEISRFRSSTNACGHVNLVETASAKMTDLLLDGSGEASIALGIATGNIRSALPQMTVARVVYRGGSGPFLVLRNDYAMASLEDARVEDMMIASVLASEGSGSAIELPHGGVVSANRLSVARSRAPRLFRVTDTSELIATHVEVEDFAGIGAPDPSVFHINAGGRFRLNHFFVHQIDGAAFRFVPSGIATIPMSETIISTGVVRGATLGVQVDPELNGKRVLDNFRDVVFQDVDIIQEAR